MRAALIPGFARAKAGFTLVEIVVAAGISGLVLAAVLAFYVNAIMLNDTSRSLAQAMSHAQYVQEAIRNVIFENIPTRVQSGEWNWDSAAIAQKGLTALKAETVSTTCTGNDLLTVVVTVTWLDTPGRSHTYTLATLMGGT